MTVLAQAVQAAAALRLLIQGAPAIRSALGSVQLLVGPGLRASTVEALGIRVSDVAMSGAAIATRDGIRLALTKTGVSAQVTPALVARVGAMSAKAAAGSVLRATIGGALVGGAIDGAIGVLQATRRGASRDETLKVLRDSVARGAASGAAGVVAAGGASALVAATGLSVLGAPVVVPLVAMVAAGAVVGRRVDRALEGSIKVLELPSPKPIGGAAPQ